LTVLEAVKPPCSSETLLDSDIDSMPFFDWCFR
jgi:hypothetical protein